MRRNPTPGAIGIGAESDIGPVERSTIHGASERLRWLLRHCGSLRLIWLMAEAGQRRPVRGCRRHWQAARHHVAERSPARIARDVLSPTFRGSRRELELATAFRLEAAVVLIFLAARCVHLGQAVVDLGLAGGAYAHERLALGVGVACWLESVTFAVFVLGARRLSRGALLGDAVFGVAGLAVCSGAVWACFSCSRTSSGAEPAPSPSFQMPAFAARRETFLPQ